MEDEKRGQPTTSVLGTPDVDTGELLPEIRGLFSRYPALQYAGPEKAGRALRALRGIRADVCAVEAVLEALRVEGEVLA
jgi:hypothetical protein